MTVASSSRQGSEVQGLEWPQFLEWWRRNNEPGSHAAFIGPTGEGKTTLATALLPTRKYVLAMDAKGGDSTLRGLERRGFVRVPKWPPSREIRKAIEQGKPARLIVGPVVRRRADLPALRSTIEAALGDAFDEGGWTVYADELQIMADRRMMGLSGSIESLLIAARDRGVSVWSSYQRPRNIPPAAAEMSRYVVLFFTQDTDIVNRLAEVVGRPKAEIRGALRGLAPYCVLAFSQRPRDPIIVTKAPRA